jgi:dCTP deaminase
MHLRVVSRDISNDIRNDDERTLAKLAFLGDEVINKLVDEGKLVHPILSNKQVAGTKIDLRIDNIFYLIGRIAINAYDPKEFHRKKIAPRYLEKHVVAYGTPFVLHPGELVLAATFESLRIPPDLVGILDGRSSLGRLGVLVHITAASVDPGFTGPLIAELLNIGRMPVDLYPLMRIGALALARIEGRTLGYKGKYLGLRNIEDPSSTLYKDEEWDSITAYFAEKTDSSNSA